MATWTREQLVESLKAAHRAGDKASAQRLADEIRRRDAAAQTKEADVTLSGAGKALATGTRRGLESIPAIGGDVGALGQVGIEKLGKLTDAPPRETSALGQAFRTAIDPVSKWHMLARALGFAEGDPADLKTLATSTSADVGGLTDRGVQMLPEGAASAVQDVTRHVPQNTTEEYLTTGAEFATSALAPGPSSFLRRAGTGFLTGLGSEAAGQATAGTAYEPWARVGAGLAGGAMLTPLLRKGPVTPQARTMLDEGVDLSASQATGNKQLGYVESQLGGGVTDALQQRQREQFSANRMQQIGAPAGTLMTPDNMFAQYNRIGGAINQVAQNAGAVPISPAAQSDIVNAVIQYQGRVGPNMQAPIVENVMNDVGSLAPGGTITGDQYAILRSQLGEEIRNAQDYATGTALRQIQEALDNAVETHLAATNPALAGQLATARQQYRLYLDLETAMANEPAAVRGQGVVTPAALGSGVKGVEGNRRLVQGQSEFTEPANAGATAMQPLPQSGTAPRTQAIASAGLLAAGEPVSAAATAFGPGMLGRVLMSGPVQRTLMSAPENLRAALTAIIAAQQAGKEARY